MFYSVAEWRRVDKRFLLHGCLRAPYAHPSRSRRDSSCNQDLRMLFASEHHVNMLNCAVSSLRLTAVVCIINTQISPDSCSALISWNYSFEVLMRVARGRIRITCVRAIRSVCGQRRVCSAATLYKGIKFLHKL